MPTFIPTKSIPGGLLGAFAQCDGGGNRLGGQLLRAHQTRLPPTNPSAGKWLWVREGTLDGTGWGGGELVSTSTSKGAKLEGPPDRGPLCQNCFGVASRAL